MTSEQMKVSNPDAIAVIQTEATKANNERIAALATAFAGDAELLAKAISDPTMTVASVKAERFDALQAETAALKAENAKLKTEGVVGFAPSDKPAPVASQQNSDAMAAEGLAIWNATESLREEFAGQQSAFIADFKRNPGDYRPKKK